MKTRLQRRGSVLILALWLAAGLAAAALLAGHSTVLRYRREVNQFAASKADYAADGMRRYVEQLLTDAGEPSAMPDEDTYTAEDLTIGECRVWLLGQTDDPDADEPAYALQDESARLNLNTATLEMLEALPGMTQEFAAAIIDWRDEDSDITSYGAESETYLALDPPYTAKDAPFESADELRLLHGFEAYLLNGVDRNRNFLLETWEKDLADQTQERLTDMPDFGLLQLVTVYSREPNTTADGQARTALSGNPQAVRQALVDTFGERGEQIATQVGVTAGMQSVLELAIRGQLTDEEAVQAFDKFTVVQGDVIPGRVNINTAPREVLACLPGVGEDNADQLIAYRQQNADSLTSPLWLAKAIGDDAAIIAGPYVTTRSYQKAADVVAVGPDGRSFRRIRYVIDCFDGTPRTIARQDLTYLGWPLGADLYDTLVTRHGEEAP